MSGLLGGTPLFIALILMGVLLHLGASWCVVSAALKGELPHEPSG